MKFLILTILLSPLALANSDVVDSVCERMQYKDCSLVKAIIKVESNNNPLSIGQDGAGSLGLMQIKCSTARMLDKIQGRKTINCKQLFDSNINIEYGIRYLNHIEELLTKKPTTKELLSVYNGGYEWKFINGKNTYRVKRCNAISIKKKRKCKKGEPFNIEYSRKIIQTYNKITGSNSNGT